MKSRSPILNLIDAACGIAPGTKPDPIPDPFVIDDPVKLVCRVCSASIVVQREPDFFEFSEIVTVCPGCNERGNEP